MAGRLASRKDSERPMVMTFLRRNETLESAMTEIAKE
jgi:hypothetical protein